jgi:branched-chain amino acid transport system substrate-binding protein
MGITEPTTNESGGNVEYRPRTLRHVAVGVVLALATASLASGVIDTADAGASTTHKIPSSAFHDHTGITKTHVQLGNVSTLTAGLFKGATVGALAYADYVNSKGGINGRKLVVTDANDQFTGAGNKQATQAAANSDFALVGSFSLEDGYGGKVLAANPGIPNVSVVLDPTTNKLPNTYSPVPLNDGWEQGPMQYFKTKFPNTLHYAASMVAGLPSGAATWAGEKYVLQKVGFKVIYEPTYTVTTTDFTQYVITMKNMGVKILFVDQMAETYASALLKALNQQDFHPVVVLGAATYTDTLVADSGGAANVNGDYLQQNAALYLGQDSSTIPAVATFLHWVHVASPGFHPDIYALYAWLSAQLFSQALKNAGTNPSRGSLLQALSKITTFDGNHIIAPNNPAAKSIANCYLLGHVVNGKFQRMADPSASSSTHGYRCDYSYVSLPGS